MKVEDYVLFATQLNKKFSISPDELHLLSFIVGNWKDGVVTITPILEAYQDHASPATTHKRLGELVKTKILTKTVNDKDTRIKTLAKGSMYNDLVKFLKEV
jgi:hypothetical protein